MVSGLSEESEASDDNIGGSVLGSIPGSLVSFAEGSENDNRTPKVTLISADGFHAIEKWV